MLEAKKTIAVVTGGGSGLGKECARLLVQRGLNTCIVGRRSQILQHALDEFPVSEADRLSFVGDIADSEDVARLSRFLGSEGYSVKWLLNVAGEGFFGTLLETTVSQIENMLRSNLLGAVLVTRQLMREIIQNQGVICTVVSASPNVRRADESAYCATKWGVKGFVESLRAEMKDMPVHLMAVYPGEMDTPFWMNSPHHVTDPGELMLPSVVADRIVSNLIVATPCKVTELTIRNTD